MFTYLIAATEVGENKFGFIESMKEGGPVAWIILTVMMIMLVGSLYILFSKLFEQSKVVKQYKKSIANFWRAPSLKDGATKLEKNSAWRQLADDAIKAQDDHHKMDGAGSEVEYVQDSILHSQESINSSLAGGLPFLASVGATAPFIGLLGTVIGIYRALIKIGMAGSASIDKVAGPVGEALIMTAIGLIVAVPAVLAFNWLQSRNRRIAALMTDFCNDILAFVGSGGTVKPTVAAAPKAAAKTAPKPAARPAGSK